MKIKEIPEDESILFNEKVDFIDSSIIKIPSLKKVHFIITNKAVYIKIANVLVDLTGAIKITPSDISEITIGKYLWSPKLSFLGSNNKKTSLVIPKKFIQGVLHSLEVVGFKIPEQA